MPGATDDDLDEDDIDGVIDLGDIVIKDTARASRTKLQAFQFAGLTALLDLIELASMPEPNTLTEVKRMPDAEQWMKAVNTEYTSQIHNHTWQETELVVDKKPISVRWVFKRKIGPDGSVVKWKARMVVRGFEQVEGTDYDESYALVAKHTSYRFMFALAAKLGWQIHMMDVITAFLNSPLQEEVYIRAPPGFPLAKGKVLRLLRALYGLRQASRAWYLKLTSELRKQGWRTSRWDECVFIHDKVQVVLLVWVDDFIFFGKSEMNIVNRKNALLLVFDMTDDGQGSYVLGMHIRNKTDSLHVN